MSELNNIIILGCQRSGKTTLANMISRKSNYNILSVDSLIYAFQNTMPELNINRSIPIIEKSPILTNFVASYYKSFSKLYPEQRIIIDTCQMLPFDVKMQKYLSKCKIIVLGYPNGDIKKVFEAIRYHDINIKSAHTKSLSDEELYSSIEKWIKYSQFLKKQTDELDIPFYETDCNERERLLENITNHLIE